MWKKPGSSSEQSHADARSSKSASGADSETQHARAAKNASAHEEDEDDSRVGKRPSAGSADAIKENKNASTGDSADKKYGTFAGLPYDPSPIPAPNHEPNENKLPGINPHPDAETLHPGKG